MLHYFSLCLLVGLTAQAVVRQPSNRKANPTIISSMKQGLTSKFGSCSFPPEDVLSDNQSYSPSFGFWEKCNVGLPLSEGLKNDHTEYAKVLLCMTLYDIGLKICGGRTLTEHNKLTHDIPHNATELSKLLHDNTGIDVLLNNRQSDLCSSLMNVLYEPVATKDWNLKATFQTNSNACSRICLEFDDSVNEFCKLIFWGSNMLRKTKVYEDDSMTPLHDPTSRIDSKLKPIISSDYVNDSNSSSGIGLGRTSPSEVVIVETQSVPHIGLPVQGNSNMPTSRLIPSSHNDGLSPDTEENTMIHNDENNPGEHQTEEKQILSSLISDTSRDKSSLTRPTLEHFPINNNDERKQSIHDQRQLSSTSNTTSNSKSIGSQDAGNTLLEKSSFDAITTKNKHGEDVNTKAVQSIKSSSSTTIVSIESLSEDILPVQDTAQKTSVPVIEGNQDVSNEEFTNIDDQGEDGDDQIFPDPLDKTEMSENENYIKPSLEESSQITNGNLYGRDRFEDSEDSHFFGYFLTMIVFCIVGYLVFHNKQKILALAVEGRSRRSNRRRPNTANYHKLDSNLEEAVSSPCNTSVTHVIY